MVLEGLVVLEALFRDQSRLKPMVRVQRKAVLAPESAAEAPPGLREEERVVIFVVSKSTSDVGVSSSCCC